MKRLMKLVTAVLLSASFLVNNTIAQGGLGISEEHITVAANFAGNKLTVKAIQLSTGVQLEYTEQGDAKGIPVILLHGFTDSRKSFEEVLPHLPSSMHVFAISQRGHGNSSKHPTRYHPEDFAKDIADFIKQKKLNRPVMVGHSMGSTNAQCFAVNYPSLTRALVLVGSFVNYNTPPLDELKRVVGDLKDPVDSTFAAEFQASTIVKPIRDTLLKAFIGETLKLPAHVWKGVVAGWPTAEYIKSLQTFTKPALIIWGDKDPYCPKEHQELLNKTLKKSKLLMYEGIGHAVHWEDPKSFADDIVNFIQTVQ
jgi:pimeloyl-ACP methyl ester carboxylesterase